MTDAGGVIAGDGWPASMLSSHGRALRKANDYFNGHYLFHDE